MNLNVMVWNLRDGFTDADRAGNIQQQILDVRPDIAVFPESRAEQLATPDTITDAFISEGYDVYDTDYNDQDLRRDRHGLTVIGRSELVTASQTVRLAGRNALLLTLEDETILLGAHFVDRIVLGDGSKSSSGEDVRVRQAEASVSLLTSKAILAGDLNTMHRRDAIARALRLARMPVQLLPSIEPAPGVKPPKIRRLGSLAQRLVGMAEGRALQVLEDADFIDADPEHVPTLKKGPMAAQLDHIMARDVAVTTPTKVHAANGLSDHMAITATLSL